MINITQKKNNGERFYENGENYQISVYAFLFNA